MKKVFLLMAYSGAGKTEIAKALEEKGYDILQSYTTRKKRNEDEWGHTFSDEEQYNKHRENGEIVAYSYFDGSHYYSTRRMVHNSDIYLIDPDGIEYLKDNIKDIEFITIYLKVDKTTRMNRMIKRGDDAGEILKRVTSDGFKFINKRYDYQVINYDFDKAVKIIDSIIKVEREEI
jgi:Guanylate kinase